MKVVSQRGRIIVNQDVGSMGRMSKVSMSQGRKGGVNKGDSSVGETSVKPASSVKGEEGCESRAESMQWWWVGRSKGGWVMGWLERGVAKQVV